MSAALQLVSVDGARQLDVTCPTCGAEAGRRCKATPEELDAASLNEGRVFVEHEDRAAAAANWIPPQVDDVDTRPRPSCCVICTKPVRGYATCGLAQCIAELGKRQRERR